jgi:hypothetical protein
LRVDSAGWRCPRVLRRQFGLGLRYDHDHDHDHDGVE